MTHRKTILLGAVIAAVGLATFGTPKLAQAVDVDQTTTGMHDEQRQSVDDRKAAIEQRLEALKGERGAKLAAKRLEICEKRQSRINASITQSTDRGTKQLAVFQKIEERVKQFYVNKNLSSDSYDAAVAVADEKKIAAIAAMEVSGEVNFDCAATSSTKPGNVIKEAMSTRHTALKDYRTAIKNLILVVKKAHNQQQKDSSAQQPDPATKTETKEKQ